MYLTRPLSITFLILVLALALAACNDHGKAPVLNTDGALQSLNTGYGILHTTLRDEQHLKTIRLIKTGLRGFVWVKNSDELMHCPVMIVDSPML